MDTQSSYEAPTIVEIGAVSDLTAVIDKEPGNADPGVTFQGNPTSIVVP
jgi:hypothetical protein